MAYEQRELSGSLFKNDRKENENHADYNGSCLVGGVEYWMNAWVKQAASGKKFFSFSFKPKNQQAPPAQTQQQTPPFDPTDDIPF